MREISFHGSSFDELCEWEEIKPQIFRKIKLLIRECRRNPFQGIGKPEPLKGDYKGYWSRRITDEHRLIYKVTDTEIIVASCKGHYE